MYNNEDCTSKGLVWENLTVGGSDTSDDSHLNDVIWFLTVLSWDKLGGGNVGSYKGTSQLASLHGEEIDVTRSR